MEADFPIFIHSLFRSGSTYLFQVFRRSMSGYWCYQEPFNEHLLYSGSDPGKLLDPHGQKNDYLRHPNLGKPYFYEFYVVADEVGKIFRKEFSYDHYFFTKETDSAELEIYLKFLVEKAQGRPVLQFCRSAGRVQLLNRFFPDSNSIFLWRNPWDQWWSYKVDQYFDRCNLLIANSKFSPKFLKTIMQDVGVQEFHSESFNDESKYFENVYLKSSDSYKLFYALWCHAFIEARPHCDFDISIDQLSLSEEYRCSVQKKLRSIGVGGVCFDDCSSPCSIYGQSDVDFFRPIEEEVHRHLLQSGVSASDLENLSRCNGQFPIVETCLTGHERALQRDAEKSRQLARKLEDRLAEKCIQLNAVYGSTSWRITGPLRYLASKVNNV